MVLGQAQPRLTGAGWTVHAIDLPSVAEKGKPRLGLHDDARAVRERLNSIDGPVVVVAHSYGGAPVTQGAAGVESVRHIIYLAAFPLDEGESLAVLTGGEVPRWWNIDAETVTPETPRQMFYHDMGAREAEAAAARLLPHSMSAVTERATAAAWENDPGQLHHLRTRPRDPGARPGVDGGANISGSPAAQQPLPGRR